MSSETAYESPLSTRYASAEMSAIFSPRFRAVLWRRLWIALAKAEQRAGLAVSQEQIDELIAHADQPDLARVAHYEQDIRHDVMAHIRAYGDQCPKAKPIIHLGATSTFVTDNGDVLQMREALQLIRTKLVQLLRQLKEFSWQHRRLACLSYTHLQTAQPTTVGKRACLWAQDFLFDGVEIDRIVEGLRFLGVKGATGTQASLMELCKDDRKKVKQIESDVAHEMKMASCFTITSQTYPRKQDIAVLDLLRNIAVSAHKFATDLRLLAHLKEIEEPFEEKQVGSSAMPYKRNPMLSERICSLARFAISLAENPPYTAALQWLERSLDDSANRRLCIPEAFLTIDAILNLMLRITARLTLYPKMIERNLQEELPFLSTENILMKCVQKGGDRQAIHEHLRKHCLAASQRIKQEGATNDLSERILKDAVFGLSPVDLKELMSIEAFIGTAPEQVEEFIQSELDPYLQQHHYIKAPEPQSKVY